MITLKINNYTKDEKSILYDVLTEGKLAICAYTDWKSLDCTNCPSKRVCDDVQSTLDYLVKQLTK